MTWTRMRAKYLYDVLDKRAGSDQPPLLAVSIHRGVVPRSDLTEDEPRADDLANYKMCEPGDIVLNRMRAFQGGIGLSHHRGIVSPDYMVLRPRPGSNGRFLHHLFRSKWFVGEMVSRLRGIGNTESGAVRTPRINPEDMGEIAVPVPSADEQRRIADFLDAETARIDRLIAERDRQIALLTERSLALISEAFASLPESRMVRLGYLARVQSGLTVDGGRDISGDVVTRPYLRVANVQSGFLDLEGVTDITVPRHVAAATTLRPGDVLMTEGGDLDKLGRGTVWNGQLPGCLHQNHVFAVRPDPTALLPEYLALFTRSVPARMHFERTGTKTTNLASTSSSKIKDLLVPTPAIAVQRDVHGRLTSELELMERLAESLSAQTALASERKQALITAAVTGQFDVTTGRGVDLS